MGPLDYSISVADPFTSAIKGYQAGMGIRDDRAQQQALIAQQQAQARQQEALQRLAQSPTADNYANAFLAAPGFREQLESSWKTRNEAQQSSDLQLMSQTYSALKSKNPEIAAGLLEQRAQAMENGGGNQQQVATLRTMAQLAKEHPEFAEGQALAVLQSVPGGDKVISSIATMGQEKRAQDKAPAELAEANAKASSATTAAKFAESKAVMDLKLSQSQIEKMAADTQIARENARIAAINAATSREGNDLKRQELQLKLQEAITARDEKVRNKVADVESARSNIDNFLNTADKIIKTPLSVIKQATGTVDSKLPTVREATGDFETLVDTLGSQAFLSQIPSIKGTGALSNAEGEKLQSALQNISLKQTGPRLVESVREAQRLLLKARTNLATRYGVPDTVPDRPALSAPGLPAGFKILGKEQ